MPFALFPTSGRTPKEACNPQCLVPTVKRAGGSVIIWAAISWYSAGSMIYVNGRNTASDYVDSLGSQVHPVVQMLYPNNEAAFQDDSSPMHTARSVQSWFGQYEDALQHLWPAQSPHLNIIEPL
jgi:hypothetical protein